ncbi:MAG: hypothetical protein V2A73_13880 [Pseudomonadota bacterium]
MQLAPQPDSGRSYRHRALAPKLTDDNHRELLQPRRDLAVRFQPALAGSAKQAHHDRHRVLDLAAEYVVRGAVRRRQGLGGRDLG